jgi:hypothetical protein
MDICPMVFLGRTERLKTFQWNLSLPVGEHELFFASNKYRGIQVAVCSDVSFTHFRVPTNRLPADYPARRERQRDLMRAAFSRIGVGQTYYFFHKYSHQDETDFESLLSKGVNPYSVRDDSGDSVDSIAGPFRFCYTIVISDDAGARARHRQLDSVVSGLKSSGACEVLFLVPAVHRSDPAVIKELALNKDILWGPQGPGRSRFIFELLRRFLFHLLIIVDERVSFSRNELASLIEAIPSKSMRLIRGVGFRAISRDFHRLLSHPMNLKHLHPSGDPLQDIDKWTAAFTHTSQDLVTFMH